MKSRMLMVGLVVAGWAVGCDEAKKDSTGPAAAEGDAAATSEKAAAEAPVAKDAPARDETAKGEEPAEGDEAEEPTAADGTDLSTPKGSIAMQIELLKKGDAKALASCFTARQASKITPDVVEKAQGQASMMNVDELFASMEEGEVEGKKTAKVKMKNGRTLTTLVLTDGKWLSDTIWFK